MFQMLHYSTKQFMLILTVRGLVISRLVIRFWTFFTD